MGTTDGNSERLKILPELVLKVDFLMSLGLFQNNLSNFMTQSKLYVAVSCRPHLIEHLVFIYFHVCSFSEDNQHWLSP